ncbi:MAG: SAM-dependent chlorinase/fluorinase, partial [Candidatus Kapaibacterium sp.]
MKRILILLSIVLVLFSCTENNVTNIVGYDRTLVIITDFSLESDIMIGIEGAVRQQHPDVDIKLIKNQAFDVFESGVLLESAAQSFPENTYFAVIVDPGTAALKFVYEAAGRRVLVPDNGASTKMRKLFSATSMHYIDDPSLFGDEFNDIPSIPYDKFWRDAILNLLSDKPLSVFGSVCETPQEINIINPKVENNSVIGQVQLTDNFGNCETNISLDFMTGFTNGDI